MPEAHFVIYIVLEIQRLGLPKASETSRQGPDPVSRSRYIPIGSVSDIHSRCAGHASAQANMIPSPSLSGGHRRLQGPGQDKQRSMPLVGTGSAFWGTGVCAEE